MFIVNYNSLKSINILKRRPERGAQRPPLVALGADGNAGDHPRHGPAAGGRRRGDRRQRPPRSGGRRPARQLLIADEPNIREVILFPMNGKAEDLMMSAPSPVEDKQLNELHIRKAHIQSKNWEKDSKQ